LPVAVDPLGERVFTRAEGGRQDFFGKNLNFVFHLFRPAFISLPVASAAFRGYIYLVLAVGVFAGVVPAWFGNNIATSDNVATKAKRYLV